VFLRAAERIIDTHTQAQLFFASGPHWPPGIPPRFNQQDAGASLALFFCLLFCVPVSRERKHYDGLALAAFSGPFPC
jgi:hypothetical protein